MKNAITLLICSLFSIAINAQGGIPKNKLEEASQIKSLPLLVVLNDSDSKFYKEFDNDLNELLQQAVNTEWTYNKEIRYISREEWIELSKDKSEKKKFAILYQSNSDLAGNVPGGTLAIGLLENKVFTHFVKLPVENNVATNYADYIHTIRLLQSDLKGLSKKEQREDAQNFLTSDTLKIKTLLIDENLIKSNLTEEIIREYYPYNLEIVPKSVIDSAILNKEKNILYTKELAMAIRPMVRTNHGYREVNSHETVFNGIFKAKNSDLVFMISANPIKEKSFKTLKKYIIE